MAFKVVTDFVPTPVLMLTCDRACGHVAQMPVKPGEERFHHVQTAFMQEAAKTGWRLTYEAHVCPQHVEKESGEEKRILVPQASFARN